MTIFSDSKDDILSNEYRNITRFELPSYTTTERDAITNWIAGELILNSTTDKAQLRTVAGAWADLN